MVIYQQDGRTIHDVPDRYREAFEKLFRAVRVPRKGRDEAAGREKRRIFDEAVLALGDALADADEPSAG